MTNCDRCTTERNTYGSLIENFLDDWYRPGPQSAALTVGEFYGFFNFADRVTHFWSAHPGFSQKFA